MSTRPLSFSQRNGYAPAPETVQLEAIDERARTDIWNVLHTWLFADNPFPYDLKDIWTEHFGRRGDLFTDYGLIPVVEATVFQGDWHEVYSLLEFLASVTPDYDRRLVDVLNGNLAYNRCGYRIVGREVVEITDETELAAIREATSLPDGSPVRRHIDTALRLFGDRDSPDYANSIKESISAVEAAARDLSGNPSATLGAALDLIAKRTDASTHPALLKGWKGIYGFTSDSGGIRHADTEDNVPATQALAQYFLVTCSAMASYLLTLKASQQPTQTVGTD